MYNFIDITEVSEGNILPSEALKINGEYIENLISGYRTLNVVGREALSPDVVTFTTGVRDGSKVQSKRYPERIITVTYQLKANSNEEFREAYNKLAAILDVEDAQLIFNDEQDKFFTGTPCTIGAVNPGVNAVVGEFEILCADPFKYSVIEYEADTSLDGSSILVDYNGTYKAYPTLEAEFYNETEVAEDGETVNALTGDGDCGYVAFFNEDKKIIQLGDPDEEETETFAKSQTLIDQYFNSEFAWGSSAQNLWTLNGGTVIGTSVQQTGSVAMMPATYYIPQTTEKTTVILNTKSTADLVDISYKIKACTKERTKSAVKVTLSIETQMVRTTGKILRFPNGYGLRGSVYFCDKWYDVEIKNMKESWSGETIRTVTLNLTAQNLPDEATELSNISFKVNRIDGNSESSIYKNIGLLDDTTCDNIPVDAFNAYTTEYFLAPSNYDTVISKRNGPSITRTIPADASGEVGATDFVLTYRQKICVGSGTADVNQRGCFEVCIATETGRVIADVRIVKSSGGIQAKHELYVDGRLMNTDSLYVNNHNKGIDSSNVNTITKTGNKIIFKVNGITHTYTVNSSLKAAKITFSFTDYADSDPLEFNGIYYVKFVKTNCDTYKDVPNKFGSNDVLRAVCKSGEILLNDVPAPELGALGNDWEDFCLTPGLNQIGTSYSSWVGSAYAPKFKVRYREVFL